MRRTKLGKLLLLKNSSPKIVEAYQSRSQGKVIRLGCAHRSVSRPKANILGGSFKWIVF